MTPSPNHACVRRAQAPAVVACAALIIGGCAAMSTQQAAPSVTPALIDAGNARGLAPADIKRGREIFVGRCAECHTLQPPVGRTEAQWREVLPRMARRARLDADEARAVEAYVFSARTARTAASASN